jgi:hypothetical protein
MRELPDSIAPLPAMALLPDRGTARYEERVVELERPHGLMRAVVMSI